MPELNYDLHIHSCLSPCGDDDMTPANIVGMAVIKGLDLIAVTDHNSCKNCPAVLTMADAYGLTALPGMELTTSEEVHVVCLFADLKDALAFDEYVYSRLMPTLPPETVIGVRVPLLRKLAKQLADTPEAEAFLQELPHFYCEENALHAFLLEPVRDYGIALAATERFLPYVDNWAVCDSFSPKVFAQHKPELLPAIRRWLGSDQVYTVRYGIGMLMRYYLDDAFRPEYLAWVAAVHSEEYYVNMMRAWYFATALAKQPAAALPWLTEKRLDVWTHNKTIQKAVESRRIPPEQKQALRALRIRSQKLCEERRV